jgi:type II secretory pathway component PulF
VIGQDMYLIIVILFLVLYIFLGLKKPVLAMVTSPILSAALFILCWEESPAAMVLSPFIFGTTLLAVSLSRREPDPDQWPQRMAKCMLLGFVLILLVGISVVVFQIGSIVAYLFCGILIALIVRFAFASRHAITAYVISTIGSSMRQNLPLPMALESAASGRKDVQARILSRIKKWMIQGYSLSESIKRGYPKCPGYVVAMLSSAEKIDQLPQVIKSLESDMIVRAHESRKIRPVHPIYPIIMIVFVFLLVLALNTFVLPKSIDVLQELGAPIPSATQFLINFVRALNKIGPILAIVLALVIFVIIPLSIRAKFRPRRPEKPYLVSRIADFVKWHLPILHWFENNYSMVQLTELLRLSLMAGCTVNDAIANALNLDTNSCFKKRLAEWLAKVEQGENIAVAARETGLGKTLAWAFDQQTNQGNTVVILDTLESFYRSNYGYRANLARFILWPCVIIMIGLMVGFVVYASFSPLVAILNHMVDLAVP